ncbi:MAG: DUF4288 domain-containing protein [Chloroflexota bacterium]|nr:DUF4288 domain-containing protein [Chloroflexota bacterium]
MWYAAHIIQYARFLDGAQDVYPCYENVVLIQADSSDHARQEAARIGQAAYGPTGGGFTWGGRPAEWVFAGIRKVIQCDNTDVTQPAGQEPGFTPGHGTEVTYSTLEVDSIEALDKLVAGAAVAVRYEE